MSGQQQLSGVSVITITAASKHISACICTAALHHCTKYSGQDIKCNSRQGGVKALTEACWSVVLAICICTSRAAPCANMVCRNGTLGSRSMFSSKWRDPSMSSKLCKHSKLSVMMPCKHHYTSDKFVVLGTQILPCTPLAMYMRTVCQQCVCLVLMPVDIFQVASNSELC